MKKLLYTTLCLLAFVPVAAQETYEDARIVTEDLNGTARYVGMGGAMEALGADISTIGSNPAGLGLFRHTSANTSFSMVSQEGAKDFDFGSKSKMSFDQIGFVYAHQTGSSSFLNFGFNYHKSNNFNYILRATDDLNGASQNKLSSLKGYLGVYDMTWSSDNEWVGNSSTYSQVDYLYTNVLDLYDYDANDWGYYNANSYEMNRANKGSVGEYDFNLSGNINDRVYLGLTFGVKDVLYKSYGEYHEILPGQGGMTLSDERRIDGSGFDIKLGAIFRPIEESPFRFGVYVHTPTWYDLTTKNSTRLDNFTSNIGNYDYGTSSETYDYKLYTPWKFGFSLGHTIGDYLALGATYEYTDYSNLDTRINSGTHYDWYYDSYYESSESDKAMNNHTEETLKGVHTLKVGAEIRPMSAMAIRVGYNYVSPMYNMDGYKDSSIDSPGSYYASATDYTNWKATHRVTLGLGYSVGDFNFDVAYQFNEKKGEFSPFMSYYDNSSADASNICDAVKIDHKRHQVLFTLGYHF